MDNNDFEKLKQIKSSLKKLNEKVKLIALLERAKFEFDKNNNQECERFCEEILNSQPNNAIALRGLGCVKQANGEFKQAISYYKQALKFSNNKEIEYTLLGTIYYNEDNLEKAIEYYNKAIEYNDDYYMAYEGRNQSMLEYKLKIIDLQDSLIKQNLF